MLSVVVGSKEAHHLKHYVDVCLKGSPAKGVSNIFKMRFSLSTEYLTGHVQPPGKAPTPCASARDSLWTPP